MLTDSSSHTRYLYVPQGLFGPHAAVWAAQVPAFVAFVVVATDVDTEVELVVDADVVEAVAPVPLVVDAEEVGLVVVLVVGSGPSQSSEIFNSAQFQNCSGTPRLLDESREKND